MAEAPLQIDAVCGDKCKKGKHVKGKKGKDKGKHKDKYESSPRFEGYCGHSGKWGHKQKYCRYKNTVAEVDEEESAEPSNRGCEQQPYPSHTTTSWFVFSWNCAVHDGIDLHADGGSRAVWLALGSDDARMRECWPVELLVDTGATVRVCGPHDFTHAALKNGPRPALKTSSAVETQRCEDCRLPVSSRKTASGLHSCRCEATNSQCLKVDGQRHRNIFPSS